MAACTLVLQGAAVTTGRGSHSAACITPLTPPGPTCPPHPTNQYRRLKWYSGVLHDEDFGTLFFVLLLPWRTAARRESNTASRLTRHGHAGHRLSGGRAGARHGRRWCAGQDCGERGAAAETEGGWVASFSAAPSREPMIHAAGERRRRWRRQQRHSQVTQPPVSTLPPRRATNSSASSHGESLHDPTAHNRHAASSWPSSPLIRVAAHSLWRGGRGGIANILPPLLTVHKKGPCACSGIDFLG